jgi:two-component system, OmpR family, response regulator ResD
MALAAAERRGFKLGLVGEPNRMSSYTDLDAAGSQTRTDRRERRRLQRPLRVLVVDEEPMYCALTETILSSQGDDVVSVDNAPEALTLATRTAFDLVVADSAIGEADGTMLADEIRARCPALPLILTSREPAHAQGDGSQLASVGADRLAKPFTALQLADAIEKALAPEDDAA